MNDELSSQAEHPKDSSEFNLLESIPKQLPQTVLPNQPTLLDNVVGFFSGIANTIGTLAASVFQGNDASNASCMETHEKNAECLRTMANDPSLPPEHRMEAASIATSEAEKKDRKDSENKRWGLETVVVLLSAVTGLTAAIAAAFGASKRNKDDDQKT